MLVADVGNTRIKWGLCGRGGVDRAVSLADDTDAWRRQLDEWRVARGEWTVAGVHPERRDRLAAWLREQKYDVRIIDHFTQIPLTVDVDAPEKVGIDRLLGVLAAKQIVTAGQPAVVVDVGSAVTVNLLDDNGAFAGGAIFPGLRLMAEALHDYTAQLPLVKVTEHAPVVPAKSTVPAIAAGIHWAVVGGVSALVREIAPPLPEPLPVFLTGGDAAVLAPDLHDGEQFRFEVRPLLTLEGLRLVAKS